MGSHERYGSTCTIRDPIPPPVSMRNRTKQTRTEFVTLQEKIISMVTIEMTREGRESGGIANLGGIASHLQTH